MSGKRVMASHLTPEPKSSRMEPMIDYFVERYLGLSGSDAAMVEIANMMHAGVKLTPELVDHVAKKHNLESLRKFVAEHRPQEPLPPPPPNWVYFIRVDGRVKIGTSVDPAARAVALSLRIKDVLAVMEGDRKLERSLHAKFAKYRIDDTEWFTWCDEIARFIDEHADPFTKDHRSYRTGAKRDARRGYNALARALDNGG